MYPILGDRFRVVDDLLLVHRHFRFVQRERRFGIHRLYKVVNSQRLPPNVPSRFLAVRIQSYLRLFGVAVFTRTRTDTDEISRPFAVVIPDVPSFQTEQVRYSYLLIQNFAVGVLYRDVIVGDLAVYLHSVQFEVIHHDREINIHRHAAVRSDGRLQRHHRVGRERKVAVYRRPGHAVFLRMSVGKRRHESVRNVEVRERIDVIGIIRDLRRRLVRAFARNVFRRRLGRKKFLARSRRVEIHVRRIFGKYADRHRDLSVSADVVSDHDHRLE